MSSQDPPFSTLHQHAAIACLPIPQTASDSPRQSQSLTAPQNESALSQMTRPKILLVDDDTDDIFLTRKKLEAKNCEVVTATSVSEALRLTTSQRFDVLITDLHMPDPGDGFAVVTSMSHFQPQVLNLVVSDFPDMQKAMAAILLEADEVLVKPFDVEQLAPLLDKRKHAPKPSARPARENVASILERDCEITIQRWLSRVDQSPELMSLPLSAKERTNHLPEMIRNITARLRGNRAIEGVESPSQAAEAHGQLRYRQGYSAPLIVQESRILQVCIFETIERNVNTVDFTSVLPDIMIIADEVDAQLKQSIESFLTMQRAAALGQSS
jgi:CheY-like chemotaxis protein